MNVSPTSASVLLSTRLDWNRAIEDRVVLDLAAPDAPAAASHVAYDPLWDGPYAQPAQPGDFRRQVGAGPATAALRDAIAGLDLARAAPSDPSSNGSSYATIHLRFAQRPEGLDRLRPFQDADGIWTVGLSTSIGDLLADPALAPVVEAARAVLAAAR